MSSAGLFFGWVFFFFRTDHAVSPEKVNYVIEPYAFTLCSAKNKTNCD